MGKSQVGVSMDDELWEAIDEVRETDQSEVGYQNRSEFIEEIVSYGLTVRKVYDELGLTDVEPHNVRSFVHAALKARYEEVEGEEAPRIDVQWRPYDFEK